MSFLVKQNEMGYAISLSSTHARDMHTCQAACSTIIKIYLQLR